MYEIVIVRSYLYRMGEGILLDKLLEDEKAATNKWGAHYNLWWFDYPDQSPMTLEKASWRVDSKGSATMLRDAIRFKFECLPNIRADHFDVSVFHSEFDFNGNDVFKPFLDQFVAIVRPHLTEHKWSFAYDFYGLFEVETDEFRDEDGGLDSIDVWAVFLGEMDMEHLPVVEATKPAQLSQYLEDGLPHYSSRD